MQHSFKLVDLLFQGVLLCSPQSIAPSFPSVDTRLVVGSAPATSRDFSITFDLACLALCTFLKRDIQLMDSNAPGRNVTYDFMAYFCRLFDAPGRRTSAQLFSPLLSFAGGVPAIVVLSTADVSVQVHCASLLKSIQKSAIRAKGLDDNIIDRQLSCRYDLFFKKPASEDSNVPLG